MPVKKKASKKTAEEAVNSETEEQKQSSRSNKRTRQVKNKK